MVQGDYEEFGSFAGFEIVNTAPGSFGNLPSATPVTISNGAALDMTGDVQTVLSLSSTDGKRSQVLLGGGTLTITGPAVTTFDGTISGAGGSLTLEGGSLTLSGTNTYTGGTTVAGGELIVTNSEAIADGTSLTVGDPSLFATAVLPTPVSLSKVTPLPEPTTLALLSIGLLLLLSRRRRSRIAY
jgi:autotransporter-associated beta strand protein